MLISALYFCGLGLIVGSFINVLVLRKGVLSLGGRSRCPSCGKGIAWYDNVPVASWLYLRGRCRSCGSSISIQYPLVEAATGGLFAVLGWWAAPYAFSPAVYPLIAVYLAMVGLLVAIAVYDLLHTIIPDEWSYTFAALAFVSPLIASFPDAARPFFMHVIAGPVTALPLFALWFVSRGKWMGLGDPKLALGIGWLLGPPISFFAVFGAFILGSVVLLPMLVYERLVTHKRGDSEGGGGLTMKSEVPFGPFLIASCLFFWFGQLYGVEIPLYLLGI